MHHITYRKLLFRDRYIPDTLLFENESEILPKRELKLGKIMFYRLIFSRPNICDANFHLHIWLSALRLYLIQ